MAEKLDGGKAINVAMGSVGKVTHTNHNYNPLESLQFYNLHNSRQAEELRDTLRNDKQVGLPRYGYTIDSNVLLTLGPGTKMIELVDILIDNSTESEA